ncbi:RNA polymerase sigma factor (sigma-70 family) [Allocatelliglobosispora scoriae]|uniref:RNA polymerase sigma factor (Sigma-70 family) n=1 Tax=Allocatelliglobosispora scoriae TaxID=643052 RepID=A0A841BXP0_9ACTN|nr:RNA polymerase sigma factor [Allocatelliglobosispora scoriae]MBB5873917.1 RNA polymerase sigma factor (sigma-70 family) [Allocatelliglobosispora scoriae]
MDDAAVAVGLAAGDPGALDEAYRRYASRLTAYAVTIVGDRQSAADVVHDTFVLATEHAAGLRDPDRLRSWLYAIARSVGLRVLRQRARVRVVDAVAEAAAELPDPAATLHAATTVELVWAVYGGLAAADQEMIELSVRHALGSAEIAAALGISVKHANARLSRARASFRDALGALLVARAPGGCGELAALLGGWDGALTPLLRKRLHRHIEGCAVCAAERADRMDPSDLLPAYAALPFAALITGATGHPATGVTDPPTAAVAESPGGVGALHGRRRGREAGRVGGPRPSRPAVPGDHRTVEIRWDPATGFPHLAAASRRRRVWAVAVAVLLIAACSGLAPAVFGDPASPVTAPQPTGGTLPMGEGSSEPGLAAPSSAPSGPAPSPSARRVTPSPRRPSPSGAPRSASPPPVGTDVTADLSCTAANTFRLVARLHVDTALASATLRWRSVQAITRRATMTVSASGDQAVGTGTGPGSTLRITWWITAVATDGRTVRTAETVVDNPCA